MSFFARPVLTLVVASLPFAFQSCNSSSNDPTDLEVVLNVEFSPTKTFEFSWNEVEGAEYYQLLENSDGRSGFTQVGTDISKGTHQYAHVVPLHKRMNAKYLLAACNDLGCTDSNSIAINSSLSEAIGYIKPSNSHTDSFFGFPLALSEDGTTLAVSAIGEANDTHGINSDEFNYEAAFSGAVYVFALSDNGWTQQAYIKASNAEESDFFGASVSLSADGNLLAVGAPFEESNATGINGDQNSNAFTKAGAVYVFEREKGDWQQSAYIKPSSLEPYDTFGRSVSVSADGDVLAVGAPDQDSVLTGESYVHTGAAYIFRYSASGWREEAILFASNADNNDNFGRPLRLSGDGSTLAVSAIEEGSDATGVGGDQTNNNLDNAGAVYVFEKTTTGWLQQAYLKPANAIPRSYFGSSLDLSYDGNTLAAGHTYDDEDTGAAIIFERLESEWSLAAVIQAANYGQGDLFGQSLALSSDGTNLVIGALYEDSEAIGINGDARNDHLVDAGAAYFFEQHDEQWHQSAYFKAPNAGSGDLFGSAVGISGDGSVVAVGAHDEDSSSTVINGEQDDGDENSYFDSGAVYLY